MAVWRSGSDGFPEGGDSVVGFCRRRTRVGPVVLYSARSKLTHADWHLRVGCNLGYCRRRPRVGRSGWLLVRKDVAPMWRTEFTSEVVAEIARDRFRASSSACDAENGGLVVVEPGDPSPGRRSVGRRFAAHGRAVLERVYRGRIGSDSHATVDRTRRANWRLNRISLEQEFLARPPCTIGEACTRIARLTG